MRKPPFAASIYFAVSVLCAAGSVYVLSVFFNQTKGREWFWILLTYMGIAAVSLITRRKLPFSVGFAIVFAIFVSALGITPVAAALAFLGAAAGYGSIIRRKLLRSEPSANIVFDGIVGLVPLLGLCGALLHVPIPARSVYTALTLIGLLLGAHRFSASIKNLALSIRAFEPVSLGNVAAAVLCASAVSVACLAALFPTVNYDDTAFHLRLSTELSAYGRALFDVTTQIWSVAPHYSDLFYAVPTVMAGEDARGAVNLVLILLCTTLFARGLFALQKNATVALLATALFISCPVFFLVGTTMQSELLLTTLTVAAARTLLHRPEQRSQVFDHLLTLVAVCALMAGIKTTGAMLGVILLSAWCTLWITQFRSVEPGRLQLPGLSTILYLGAAAFLALHSYVNAYIVTGNPVFPLFNGVFHSPYYAPENFVSPLYTQGPSWNGFFGMFFHTSRHLESADGVAGFQYLVMLPAALVGLWIQRKNSRLLVVVTAGIGFFLLLFSQQQYVRYLLPATALIAWPFLGLVTLPGRTMLARPTRWLLIACVCSLTLLNLAMTKKVIWYADTDIRHLFVQSGRADFEQHVSAEVALNRIVNQTFGNTSRVLYDTHRPFGANLEGTPLYTNWYNPKLSVDYAQQLDSKSIAALMDRYGVTHVMVNSLSNDIASTEATTESAPLIRVLALRGDPIANVGHMSLFALSATEHRLRPWFDLDELIAGDQLLHEGKQAANLSLPLTVDSTNHIYTFARSLDGDTALTIEATIECEQSSAFLVQVYWHSRLPIPAYYRLATCNPGKRVRVYDLVAVPQVATQAIFYLNSHPSGGAVRLFSYRVSRR